MHAYAAGFVLMRCVSAEKREFNLLLIGLDGSGKSSLLEKIKCEYSRGTPPSQHQLDHALRKVSFVCFLISPRASFRSTLWESVRMAM